MVVVVVVVAIVVAVMVVGQATRCSPPSPPSPSKKAVGNTQAVAAARPSLNSTQLAPCASTQPNWSHLPQLHPHMPSSPSNVCVNSTQLDAPHVPQHHTWDATASHANFPLVLPTPAHCDSDVAK
eukprot:157571-Chlamydomonas_euryale.AAC.1